MYMYILQTQLGKMKSRQCRWILSFIIMPILEAAVTMQLWGNETRPLLIYQYWK